MHIPDGLNISLLDVLYFSRGGGHYKTNRRDFTALSLRLRGNTVFTFGNERLRVSAGDIALVPDGIDYTCQTDGEDMIAVHFRMLNCEISRISTFTPKNPEEFTALFRKLEHIRSEKASGYILRATSVLYEILARIKEESDEEIRGEIKREGRYALAAEYMRAHLDNAELTVEEVARRINVCPSLLRREFAKRYGVSPKEYLVRLRIEYAVLLQNTGYFSQNEIAAKCGYTDVKYFRTAFRKKYGQTLSRLKYGKKSAFPG